MEHWIYLDSEDIVYGQPAIVEADIVVRDGKHILVEAKSGASKGDVAETYRIALLYEKASGRSPWWSRAS